MSEFQTISEIDEMVRRFGADRITQQAGLAQNLVALMMPSEEEYEPPPAKMRLARPIPVERSRGIDRVNVMHGSPRRLGVIATGGARNQPSSVKRFTGKKLPNTLAGSLVFSIDEYEMAQGDQAVDAVVKVMDAAGSGAGKYLARSIVNPQVATPTADVAINDATFTVSVENGYFPGQSYESVRGGVIQGIIDVADVQPNFDGGATIVPDVNMQFAITVATDTIFLLGQSDTTKRLGSLADNVDSTLDLYGIDRTKAFPAGIKKDLGNAAFGHTDGRKLCSKVHTASSEWPTHWVVSPLGRDGIVNDQIDNVRYIMGQGDGADMDPYSDAMAPIFNGLPIIAEPTCDDNVIDLINANHLFMREYWAYRPRRPDGTAADGADRSVLVLDKDNAAVLAVFDGGYGLVCYKRRAQARFTGVTA